MFKATSKTMFVLSSLMIASMLLASCTPTGTPAPTKAPVEPTAAMPASILIPFVGPLTGPDGFDGQNSAKAAELAVKQANDKGGVCGGVKLEISSNDTKSDPKEGANIASLLCSTDNVLGAVADYNSSVCLAEAPVFNECKVSQVVYYCAAPDIAKKGGAYTFRIYPPGENMSIYLADWLVNQLGYKKIATIYENTDYGLGLENVFEAKVQEFGGEIVVAEAVLKDQTDLSAVVSKIKDSNPEAVVGMVQYQVAALFSKQAKDIDFNLPLYGSDGLFSPEIVNLGGAAVEGARTVAAYMPDSVDPIVADFVKAFREGYSEDPTNAAGYAYDATNIVIAGLEATNCAGREVLQKWLAENITDYKGVTGTIALDAEGERMFAPGMYTPIEIKDGKWVEVK
ncbi:MAG: ABC transporter substrate-binding protein [Planctomycetes bacterium]|nr:ABC transporter substrate-binding protein [Planctomycetota bacterium]